MHVWYIHCIVSKPKFVFRINFDYDYLYYGDKMDDILQDISYGNSVESLTPKHIPLHREGILSSGDLDTTFL